METCLVSRLGYQRLVSHSQGLFFLLGVRLELVSRGPVRALDHFIERQVSGR